MMQKLLRLRFYTLDKRRSSERLLKEYRIESGSAQ